MVPAVLLRSWAHKLFNSYPLLLAIPRAVAVVEISSASALVLKSPTMTSPAFSVLAKICDVGLRLPGSVDGVLVDGDDVSVVEQGEVGPV